MQAGAEVDAHGYAQCEDCVPEAEPLTRCRYDVSKENQLAEREKTVE
jgi:hypothetical protein